MSEFHRKPISGDISVTFSNNTVQGGLKEILGEQLTGQERVVVGVIMGVWLMAGKGH